MNSYRKLLGVVLILVMLVSSYMTVVQIVNGLGPDRLLKSFSVNSGRDSGEFVVGDTLEFDVECRLVSGYRVSIYQNSSAICEVEGRFYEPIFTACVPLNPLTFNAGSVYTAVFNVYAYNYPLLGVCFADSADYVFEVVGVGTQLSLIGEYGDVLHCLCLCANLTDVDSYPVVNETVGFCFQFNGGGRPTDGWVSLGATRTDSDGTALLSLALNVPLSEPFLVRARHEGNENFGLSEKIVEVEVISNSSESLFFAMGSSGICSDRDVLYEGNGTVFIEVNSYQPSACLLMHAVGRYVSDVYLDYEVEAMLFYCDYMNFTGFIGWDYLHLVSEDPSYVYEANLTWSPELIGFHSLIAGVVVGNPKNVIRAMVNGTDIIASSEVSLDIQRGPSNVVLQFSEAIYGSVFPVTVAVSKPRSYQADSTAFYSVSNLGPQLTYEDVLYIIDVKASSVPVRLYVNDTLVYANSTDDNGLICYDLSINFTSVRLRAVVDDSFILFGESSEQTVVFSKVRVYDKLNVGGSNFNLSLDLSKPAGNGSYIGAAGSLKSKASLLDSYVWNVPFSVVYARIVSFFVTNSSGVATIPGGSDYLRVYNVSMLAGDVNFDNVVNAKDSIIVGAAFGSYPGHLNWNVDADINHDNIVNAKDSAVVGANFGRVGDYVLFDDGQKVYLDGQGFALIPTGVTSLTYKKNNVPFAASIEFLQKVLNRTCLSNNLGEILDAWTPTVLGSYLVHVKLARFFDVYLGSQTAITGLDGSTNLVEYFEVVKRPLDLSVSYTPEEPTLDDTVTLFVSCSDLGLGEPAEWMYVDFFIHGLTLPDQEEIDIYIDWRRTNSSGEAKLSFVPRTYYEQYNFFPYFYLIAVCFETSVTDYCQSAILLDTRYPTRLEFLGNEVTQVPVGQMRDFSCRLARADNDEAVVDRRICFYMNDTFLDDGYTDENGICAFSLTIYQSGLYFFKAQFSWGEGYLDVLYEYSNNITFVIVAAVEPVFVFFDIQPRDFSPNTPITLSATVYNASSNQPLQNFEVWFYWYANNGSSGTIGSDLTDGDGVASVTWTYPISGVYVFWARVSEGQQIMSSPVTLTVGKETRLSMNVSGGSGFDYTIFGKLLFDGDGVGGKQIAIKVNGTVAAVATTAYDGSYSVTLNLPAVDNQPTNYQIEAIFYGDNALNLTGQAALPNGTLYAVCTTIQYFSYKPVSNATWLTVTPQSTQVMQQPKTPEQMQQEAEQNGWLSVWHEFSWWFPWYRLHIRLTMNDVAVDVGFTPILPVCGVLTTEISPTFIPPIPITVDQETAKEILLDVFVGTAVEVFGLAGTAIAAPLTHLPGAAAIGLMIYGGGLALLIGYAVWLYSSGRTMEAFASLAGFVINGFGAAIAGLLGLLAHETAAMFSNAIAFPILGAALSNMFNPNELISAIIAASMIAFTTFAIEYIILHFIPDPLNSYFEPVFIIESFAFVAAALSLLYTWAGWW